ncbi:hypothetical protein [Klebsiella michiganensis]|uniref:hypothetical protein n=1 Tax=Klebsiella michiganensis TaxID=1134687 RepID=UPI001C825906|nr:hypothetical protein [Klebsiella michiganensis]
MTEAFKYTWLLLKEEPVYIPLIFMITGTGVISVFFVLKDFRSWWSKLILLVIDVLFCLYLLLHLNLSLLIKTFNKEKKIFPLRLKTARSPHLKHNRQDYSGQQKMPGPALMG